MTQALRSEWLLDVQSWIASAQQAGKVTQTEAEKMQKTLKYVENAIKSIGDRVGDVKKVATAHQEVAQAAEHSAAATSGITRELLVLTHELSTGQYKRFGGSLLVLAEYSTSAKAALSALVGPLGFVAAGVGILAAVVASGAHEQHQFDMMLIETGNAAGLTADRLNAMAAAAAKTSRATMGAGIESALAIAGTGRFGPENMDAAIEASLLMQRVSGRTAEEVVADLAKMRDGVAQWAAEHNKQLHFITAAQYEHIRRLEEQGRATEAMREVLAALNGSLVKSTENVGYFARAWEWVKDAASGAAEALKSWGKTETFGQQAAVLQAQISAAEQRIADAKNAGVKVAGLGQEQAQLDVLRQRLAYVQELQRAEKRSADQRAQIADEQEKGIAARKAIDDELAKTKSMVNLKKELHDWQIKFNEAAAAGSPVSAEDQKAILDQVRRKYTPPETKKLDTEFGNLVKSLQDEKVKIDAETQSWMVYGRALDNAREAVVKFRVEQGDLKGLSDKQKVRAIDLAAQADAAEQAKRAAESIAWAKKKTEALIAEASARAMSSREEFVQRTLHEQGAQALNKESAEYRNLADAARAHFDALVSTPALAKWAQSMDEEVRKIREETAALGMGTLARKQAEAEVKLHAAAMAEAMKYPERETEIWLRYSEARDKVRQAIQGQYDASRSAKVGEQTALQRYIEDATDQAKNAENLITGALKRAEDAFINFAKTGKLSLGDVFSFMAEEYLRQFFRMQVASAIKTTAGPGGSLSLGNIFSTAASWASGFFSHATGADYVPYDGYPAMLHEGERVLTKQEARQGAGGGIVVDARTMSQQIGAGVSRAEMRAAAQQASRATEANIRRLLGQKGITI